MIVTPIKTDRIVHGEKDIFSVLDKFIPQLEENSVVAVTSKIVSICEGRVVPIDENNPDQKDELIKEEAQYFIPREKNKYNISVTVTNNIFIATAGIDESNGNGNYILWPKDPQASANAICDYLKKKFEMSHIGVIITDSKTAPLRWGVTAVAIAYSGFLPLKNYMQTPDIFGRPFAFEQMSIIDNLACSATLVMGEGAEQTPLAVITDIPMVKFVDHEPTQEELDSITSNFDKDMYGEFLKNAPWEKGKKSR